MKNILKKFLDRVGQFFLKIFQYQKRDALHSIKEIPPFTPVTWQKSRTANFPRIYFVPKLILSVVYEQDNEYIGVDMSQYESNGIAHYFVTKIETNEEVIADYNKKRGYEALSVEEEMTTSYFNDAFLIEWVSGLWKWYD